MSTPNYAAIAELKKKIEAFQAEHETLIKAALEGVVDVNHGSVSVKMFPSDHVLCMPHDSPEQKDKVDAGSVVEYEKNGTTYVYYEL